MKKLIKSFFRSMGIDIKKINNNLVELPIHDALSGTMKYGLKRMKNKNIDPKTIIDLGAAQGRWSLEALQCWPDAQYMLVEPLSERQTELMRLQQEHKNFHIVNAAAGSCKGTVNFLVSDDLDGSGIYDNSDSVKTRQVNVAAIDDEVIRLGLRPPFMIKFDTHGFEGPILEGARNTLNYTELIVMECYAFRISKNCLTLHEMISCLEKLGFRIADAVDIMRRPGDELLWQCDLFFLKSANPFFKRSTYAQ